MTSECATFDYTEMSTSDLLGTMSDDASRWAAAFCQIARKRYGLDIDEAWMVGWFANAIEHSTDVRQARARPRTEPVIECGLNDHP